MLAGAVPACSGPGEAYVLRCILHAKPDMEALPVLKRVHIAMGEHRSYLVLVERCLTSGDALQDHIFANASYCICCHPRSDTLFSSQAHMVTMPFGLIQRLPVWFMFDVPWPTPVEPNKSIQRVHMNFLFTGTLHPHQLAKLQVDGCKWSVLAGASAVPLQQALSDLHVMVLANGRERNLEEWRSLLQSASFKLVYCHTMQTSLAIMVAMKA